MSRFKEIIINIVVAIICLVGGVYGIYSFFAESIGVWKHIRNIEPVINIPKGTFYIFGASLILLCVGFVIFYEKILLKKPSKQLINILGSLLFGGFGLMFILPHAISYIAESKLEKMGYSYCSKLSRAWLHNKDIAYVKDERRCVAKDKTP